MNEHNIVIQGTLPPWAEVCCFNGTARTYYGAVLSDLNPQLETYWLGKNGVQFYTYMLTVLSGAGKSKEPMTVIDPTLNGVLNKRKYFSYSFGDVLSHQHDSVMESVAIRQPGTFLFAPVYNLQKATTRPRVWSLSLVPRRVDGSWTLHGQAVMGHCSVWPMLIYEMVGALTIGKIVAAESKLPLISWQWMFHSLHIPADAPHSWVIPETPPPTQLPSASVANALLAAEVKLRKTPSVRPVSRVPLDAYSSEFITQLQAIYVSKEVGATP